MKKLISPLLVFTLATLFSLQLQAQQPEWTSGNDDSQVFDLVTPQPLNLRGIQSQLEYPEPALNAGIEGSVQVRIRVDDEGQYEEHRIISSPNDYLAEAVEDAIPYIYYEPANLMGERKPGWVKLTFNFHLTD